MKIETQLLDDHQARLTIEVDADQMENMKRRAARKIARGVKISGFRPGKAPYPVILRQVGEGAVIEQALKFLVEELYPKAIEEAEIKPYGPGSLENVSEELDAPVLKFIVPLEAEVILGDYRSVRKAYKPAEVDELEIDKVLQDLRARQAIVEPVERPAQEGDLVAVRISAKRLRPQEDANDETEDNEADNMLMREQSIQLMILSDEKNDDKGNGEETEWPFPGFSHNLKGLSIGNELAISYIYPEDAKAERFRGANAEFHVVIESLKSRTLPDLDDEFAASIGDFNDLDALRSEIRSMLEIQAEQQYNENYNEEILDQALELATIKFSPPMLEREVESVISAFENRLKQQGMEMDLYLKTHNLDMDGLRKEALPAAELQLKQKLFLLELAEVENIQVNQDEIQTEARNTLNYLTQSLSRQEARKLSERDLYGVLVGNILTDRLVALSMARLRDLCSGKMEELEQAEAKEAVEEVQELAESPNQEAQEDQDYPQDQGEI